MRFRKLRIAFSVTCGIACVLLVVLWVRSYREVDIVFPSTEYRVVVKSEQGKMIFGLTEDSWTLPFWYGCVGLHSSVGILHERSWDIETSPLIGDRRLYVPIWFIASMAGIIAFLPWLHWRFSLRTLLIATTLVAVLLGVIVWALQ